MRHSFDVDVAKKYGVLEAIILNNMYFWIEKNKEQGINYHDGKYWTYNSIKAYSELFPYMSERQIRNALKKLIDEGILETGNYNKSNCDRTLWYALKPFGYALCKNVKWKLQKCQMDYAKMSNAFGENVKPIPYIKPDNKTQIYKSTNRFNNFNQRKYSDEEIDSLEKRLLGIEKKKA